MGEEEKDIEVSVGIGMIDHNSIDFIRTYNLSCFLYFIHLHRRGMAHVPHYIWDPVHMESKPLLYSGTVYRRQ